MKKIKIFLLAALLITGVIASSQAGTAEAAYTYPGQGYPQCTTENSSIRFGPAETNPTITVSGNTAKAVFKFPGQCKDMNIPVSFVAYKAPNGTDGKPYGEQVKFSHTTRNYNNPRSDATITINIPDCFYQLDLVIGAPLSGADFAAGKTYHGEHRFLLAEHGGSKSCTAASTTVTPPATSTPAVNITNTNTNVNTAVSTPAKPETTPVSSEPEEVIVKEEAPASGKLPDTGPGTIAAFSFGSTFMGSLLFAYRGRFSGIMDRIISRF